MDAFSSLLNVVSTLHPALALVRSLYSECKKISVNKHQCLGVGQRAVAILETLNERLTSGGETGSSDVAKDIEVLQDQFLYIRNRMADLARWNVLKCLLRASEIEEAVRASHRRLYDVCQCFMIASVMSVRYNQALAEEYRRQDKEELEALMSQAAHRDADLLRALEIGQKEQIEALRAMQQAMAKQVIESVERRFMKAGVAALQRTTGRSLPKELPTWHINIYDIDVDEDSALGEGGFGVVKKATWIGRTVAVKRLVSGTSQKMLLTEIAVWSRLRHEHVLPFFGASETADPPFIVSCYMKNGNIVEYLSLHPNSNRAILLHHVTLGMAYLHQHNVIHGDIKGANILVDDAGKACIGDFGLAKIARELQSRTSTVVGERKTIAGTLRFMAPEQMRGRLGPPSDVYSFGMLIYQLYTDEIPFMLVPDDLLLQVVMQDRLERPDSEEAASRGLTDPLWDVVMECSDPTPANRPTFDQLHLTMRTFSEAAQSPTLQVEKLTNPFRALALSRQTQTVVAYSEPKTLPYKVPFYATRATQVLLSIGTYRVVSDGRSMVSGGRDGQVHIWDASSGRLIREIKSTLPAKHAISVKISADAGFIAGASYDYAHSKPGPFRAWNGKDGTPIQTPEVLAIAAAISRDGTQLALVTDYLQLWHVRNGRLQFNRYIGTQLPAALYRLAFSPDGSLLSVGNLPWDGDITLWNVHAGTLFKEMRCDLAEASPRCVTDIIFSPDGTQLIVGSRDAVRVLDARTLKAVGTPFNHPEPDLPFNLLNQWCHTSVAISSDGRCVVSGRSLSHALADGSNPFTGTVCMWDIRTGEKVMVHSRFYASVNSVAISADSRQLAVATGDGLLLFELGEL